MDTKIHFQNLQQKFLNKKFNDVLDEGKKLLNKFKKEIFLLNICGLCCYFLSKNKEAIVYFKKAIEIDKNNYVLKINLANTLTNIGEYKEAEKIYLSAIKKQPNNPSFLSFYAIFKSRLLDNKKAIKLFNKALIFSPKDLNLLGNLAASYQRIGDFKNSEKICKKIIQINPQFVKAHIILNSFTNYENNKIHLEELLNLFNIKGIENTQKASISFALGKAFEDKKNYKEAFIYFKKGNSLINSHLNYSIKNNSKLFKSIKKIFKDIKFKKINKINKKKIIFICGLPRSGTTLVEQIISNHNKVSAAGETSFLDNIIYDFCVDDNEIKKNKITDLLKSKEIKINKEYYKLLEPYKFNTIYITDKTPLNFRWIGFIKNYFPESKIILCERNLNDVFVSIFKNNFASSEMNWAFNEKNISNFIKLYINLIKFYKKIYKDDLYKLNYEKLINNPELEVKKLLNFCHLNFEKNCLKYYKSNKSSISTASSYQARTPIYKTSLRTRKIYHKYLNKYLKLDTN